MNIEEAEKKLTEALDNAVKLGYTIVSDKWGSKEDKNCCAIGALTLLSFPEAPDSINLLQMNLHYVFKDEVEPKASFNFWDIVNGFNNANQISTDFNPGPWYQLGARLRGKYNPGLGIKEVDELKGVGSPKVT